jgi:hypothetical protein
MTSAINPNNIDGTYPVAGQDNNSQGFRDNFTNTKTNFQYAKDEISDLQGKAILKSPLSGGGNISVINNMGGAPLINFREQNVSFAFVDLGSVSGGQTINYTLGSYQQLATSGSVNLSFSGFPAAGIAGQINVTVNVTNAAHTVTLTSASSWRNVTGVQGANVTGTTVTITFPVTGFYTFVINTSDGGSTLTLSEVNKQIQAFNASTQAVQTGGVNPEASLNTTVSLYDTTTGDLSSLASGVQGQVKILAAGNVAAGNLTVTVTNPGWGGTGNVVMTGNGQTATLMYTNSKWFCIGTGPDATGNVALFT